MTRLLLAALIGMTAASARAAEIKVLASNGVKAALEELAPAFERETGNKLSITFGLAAGLKRQIEAGAGLVPPHLTSGGPAPPATPGEADAPLRGALGR